MDFVPHSYTSGPYLSWYDLLFDETTNYQQSLIDLDAKYSAFLNVLLQQKQAIKLKLHDVYIRKRNAIQSRIHIQLHSQIGTFANVHLDAFAPAPPSASTSNAILSNHDPPTLGSLDSSANHSFKRDPSRESHNMAILGVPDAFCPENIQTTDIVLSQQPQPSIKCENSAHHQNVSSTFASESWRCDTCHQFFETQEDCILHIEQTHSGSSESVEENHEQVISKSKSVCSESSDESSSSSDSSTGNEVCDGNNISLQPRALGMVQEVESPRRTKDEDESDRKTNSCVTSACKLESKGSVGCLTRSKVREMGDRDLKCPICSHRMKCGLASDFYVEDWICDQCEGEFAVDKKLYHCGKKHHDQFDLCVSCSVNIVKQDKLRAKYLRNVSQARWNHTGSHTAGKKRKGSQFTNRNSSEQCSDRYQCNECLKILSSSRSYQEHMRGHAGEKAHLCTTCSKRFNTAKRLMNHMAIVHGQDEQ